MSHGASFDVWMENRELGKHGLRGHSSGPENLHGVKNAIRRGDLHDCVCASDVPVRVSVVLVETLPMEEEQHEEMCDVGKRQGRHFPCPEQ